MSAEAFAWAKCQKAETPARTLLLWALGDSANEAGLCWISAAILTRRLNIDRSTITRSLKDLETAGLIYRVTSYRQDGGQNSNWFYLPILPLDEEEVIFSFLNDKENRVVENPSDLADSLMREIWKVRENRSAQPAQRIEALASKEETEPKARKRDPIWDAVVEVTKEDPTTAPSRSRRGKVVQGLKDAGATADEIRRRAKLYHKEWPDITLTDTALINHWDKFAPGPPPKPECPECHLRGAHDAECSRAKNSGKKETPGVPCPPELLRTMGVIGKEMP